MHVINAADAGGFVGANRSHSRLFGNAYIHEFSFVLYQAPFIREADENFRRLFKSVHFLTFAIKSLIQPTKHFPSAVLELAFHTPHIPF